MQMMRQSHKHQSLLISRLFNHVRRKNKKCVNYWRIQLKWALIQVIQDTKKMIVDVMGSDPLEIHSEKK